MNRKALAAAVLVLAVATAAGALWATRRGPAEWTTDSEAALAAVEAGRQAELQLYREEALEHYERALELDPDFAFAQLKVATLTPPVEGRRDTIAAMVEKLQAADLEALTPRERMLVETFLARFEHEPERTAELLADYLREHPDDPYAVEMRCHQLWAGNDFAPAEACYRRLIEIDPNWVEAQNRIGYLAMARGDFADAEEQFEIYRYLAPDQANPHDSLGELLLVLGRYDEAEREFHAALDVRSTFCPSWENLVLLDLLRGDFAGAEETLAAARRAGGCPQRDLDLFACRVEVWRAGNAGRWSAMREAAADCLERTDRAEMLVLALAAAIHGGAPVAGVEQAADELVERIGTEGRYIENGIVHLVVGLRALQQDDAARAVEHLRRADELLPFGQGFGILKLYGRMLLAHALRAAGRTQEAEEVVEGVRRINPSFVRDMPLLPSPAGRASAPAPAPAPAPFSPPASASYSSAG